MLLLPPANEVCEGYVFTGVCLSTLGGHAWFYLGGCVVLFGGHAWFYSGGHAWFYLGGHAWFYLGGMHGFIWRACVVFLGGHVWFFQLLWIQSDTVNEWAVRILLECILVFKSFDANTAISVQNIKTFLFVTRSSYWNETFVHLTYKIEMVRVS